jgi:hypothetical protein
LLMWALTASATALATTARMSPAPALSRVRPAVSCKHGRVQAGSLLQPSVTHPVHSALAAWHTHLLLRGHVAASQG